MATTPILPRAEALQRRGEVVQLLRQVKAYGPHLTSRCPKDLHAQERSHLVVDVHPILYHGGEKRISVRGACRCTPWKVRVSEQKRCGECVTSPTDLDAWVHCPVCKRPGQETLVAFHHMPARTICWACFIADPGRKFERKGDRTPR